MDAIIPVRYLLANSAALIAVVPAVRIIAGVLPINTVLPAVSIIHIDTIERQTVSMSEESILATSRVQVTAFAKSYPVCKQVLELCRKALPHTRGTINGVALDSILSDSANPDFYDMETGIHQQSRDFYVKFTELKT